MRKFSSCQGISDSSRGREDGFHQSLESVASVMTGPRTQQRFLDDMISSVTLIASFVLYLCFQSTWRKRSDCKLGR